MRQFSRSPRLGRSAAAAFTLAAALTGSVLTGSVLTAGPASAVAEPETAPLGIAPPATSGAHPKNDLQAAADALVDAGAVGFLARVDDGSKIRTATAGLADREPRRRLKNKDQYEAGSQTKTFVAVLTLQLVAQHQVELDAPVHKYLPGVVPNGQNITVRMLLQHTSGLFNYTEDEQAFKEILAEPTRVVTPQQILEVGLRHDPYFAPGQGWHYSNTNYVVLGELLRKVTGHSTKELIQQRIARPLKLRDTYLADPFVQHPDRGFAHGHLATTTSSGFTYTDTSAWSLSWAGAAGAVVSTSRDLSTFYSALLSGKLLPPAQLAEMKKTVDLSAEFGEPVAYGLGIFEQETPCGTVWGHDGGTLGHGTMTAVSEDGKRSLASDTNTAFAEVDPESPYLQEYSVAMATAQVTVVCAMFGQKVPS